MVANARLCVLICGLLLLGVATESLSQQFTGNIRGAVRDSDGVIPGVTVTLINEGTSVSRETMSNDAGEYNFPAIPPATYTIRTSLAGYKTFERRGVRIATQQFVTIDLLLEVGAVNESVTVTGDAPIVETSNASHGTVLSRDILEAMPSPGRNAFLIATLVPTVNWQADPRWNRQQDQICASQISLGGGGVRANNYVLDGVPISELQGRPVVHPTMEAIDDIKVQVHTFDAEMGRTGGGVFNTTARSGTNVFHGSGFYQTRPVWGSSPAVLRGEARRHEGEHRAERVVLPALGRGVWRADPARIARSSGRPPKVTARACFRSGPARCPARASALVIFRRPRGAECRCGSSIRTAVADRRMPGVLPPAPVRSRRAASSPAPSFPALIRRRTRSPSRWRAIGRHRRRPNENSLPNDNITQAVQDVGDMWTIKGEHKFTDNWSLSGLYLYNRTIEEGRGPFALGLSWLDGSNYLVRHPKVFVLNNTNILNNTTVLSLRYGYTTLSGWQVLRWRSSGPGVFRRRPCVARVQPDVSELGR